MAAPRFGIPVVGIAIGVALALAALSSCHDDKAGNTHPSSGAGGGASEGPSDGGGLPGPGGASSGTGGSMAGARAANGGNGGVTNGSAASGGTAGAAGTSGAAGAPSTEHGGIGGPTGAPGNGRGGIGGSIGIGNGAAGGASGDGSVLAAGVRWFGRVDTTDPLRPRFGWSGTGFIANLTGNALTVSMNNAGPFVFKTVVDGIPQPAFAATMGQGSYILASGLAPGSHTVALYRQTEGVYGISQLLSLTVNGGVLGDPPPASGRLIEVVGASVSCGYGDLGVLPCTFSFATENHFDTYASVAARTVNADLSAVAISGREMYRNFDGTTDGTMPKLYNQVFADAAAPTWTFRATPQAVVINLGKNDFSLGDPGPAFPSAYLAFTRTLRTQYPGTFIVCTTGPNLGDAAHAGQLAYVNQVVTTRHAEGDNNIELLDWPEEIAGEIGCDVHPNKTKQKTMGDALAARLQAKLGW